MAATLPAALRTTGDRHTAEELERSIHETFELPSEFPLEEVAALLGFLLHRGAFLRLSRTAFAVDPEEEFLWVHAKRAGRGWATRRAPGQQVQATDPD
ncbi:MAG: hypothetical protein ACE5GX_12155 [Thermoanaerobaculia bacterium]